MSKQLRGVVGGIGPPPFEFDDHEIRPYAGDVDGRVVDPVLRSPRSVGIEIGQSVTETRTHLVRERAHELTHDEPVMGVSFGTRSERRYPRFRGPQVSGRSRENSPMESYRDPSRPTVYK